MNLFPRLCFLTFVLFVTSCTDFSNRAYRYNEEVPLKPFSMKLIRTELHEKNEEIFLKAVLHVDNWTSETSTLSTESFRLRIDSSQNLIPPISNTIFPHVFRSREDGEIGIDFRLSSGDLSGEIALMLDHQIQKKGEQWTLIQVKESGAPKSLEKNEVRIEHSSRWN